MPTEAPDAMPTDLSNPLLAEWTGPYGGVPAFDAMDLDDLEPALEAGMAAHLAEIDAIAPGIRHAPVRRVDRQIDPRFLEIALQHHPFCMAGHDAAPSIHLCRLRVPEGRSPELEHRGFDATIADPGPDGSCASRPAAEGTLP